MSSNLSNAEILNNLLEGRDLDELTSRSLMQRWLNDEISDVETGAFLSALRAKSSTGIELSSMAEELLNVCELPVARPNLYLVDCLLYTSPSPRDRTRSRMPSSA